MSPNYDYAREKRLSDEFIAKVMGKRDQGELDSSALVRRGRPRKPDKRKIISVRLHPAAITWAFGAKTRNGLNVSQYIEALIFNDAPANQFKVTPNDQTLPTEGAAKKQ